MTIARGSPSFLLLPLRKWRRARRSRHCSTSRACLVSRTTSTHPKGRSPGRNQRSVYAEL